MRMFTIEIIETLEKQIHVEADTAAEAEEYVRSEYEDGDIIMDDCDHVEASFKRLYA